MQNKEVELSSVPKVCSPKVVYDFKWFLTYKYIFKYEMYKFERQAFKKIYHIKHFKNS